ncbi:DUF3016 domain-containing protein [Massilia endophytica]|uniref:DUF3016 domain-containing protein n=1 Tax=Massilia endophytica TaxID=2899220 RepID=UPI001E424A8D|nr:DUF3016 domain-containing protein [Massilia endophytica]UGQ45525.1 DUF3016 domain-containing protein [Massilia endophytica]
MKKLICTLGLLALAAVGSAAAAVTVTFAAPEKMTDVPRYPPDREWMETQLREHLGKLAEKLPAGQELTVEFLDIDMAGDVFPRVAVRDVRVMKGDVDWPRMHLRYAITRDGKVISQGESKISDSNYLMSGNRYDGEMYRYEMELLDDWFKKEVLKKTR